MIDAKIKTKREWVSLVGVWEIDSEKWVSQLPTELGVGSGEGVTAAAAVNGGLVRRLWYDVLFDEGA